MHHLTQPHSHAPGPHFADREALAENGVHSPGHTAKMQCSDKARSHNGTNSGGTTGKGEEGAPSGQGDSGSKAVHLEALQAEW